MAEGRERTSAVLAISAVRIARHTARLDDVVAFYRDGVGLPVVGSFENHDGYSGVIFALPGSAHHLEFTSDGGETKPSTPSPDDLLVFYFTTNGSLEEVAQRLQATAAVAAPANPYWQTKEQTITFLDPDGWRVVLVHPRDA